MRYEIISKGILYTFLSALLIVICLPLIALGITTKKYTKELENRPAYTAPVKPYVSLVPFYKPITLTSANIENVIDVKTEVAETYIQGWITKDNVVLYDNINGNNICTLSYNTEIIFTALNNTEWLKVKYTDEIEGYIEKKYISINKNTFNEFLIPDYSGFKSYMDYRTVTTVTSAQYQLLSIYGYTDNGFRKANGRYCIAVGSYFNTSIGQYIDLILENGVVIQCIMGDLKADIHTDGTNMFTSLNNCCSEFIVDLDNLDPFVANTGNISRICTSWNSPVKYIRVYDKNFFDNIGE